jgi:hypothetical protein
MANPDHCSIRLHRSRALSVTKRSPAMLGCNVYTYRDRHVTKNSTPYGSPANITGTSRHTAGAATPQGLGALSIRSTVAVSQYITVCGSELFSVGSAVAGPAHRCPADGCPQQWR